MDPSILDNLPINLYSLFGMASRIRPKQSGNKKDKMNGKDIEHKNLILLPHELACCLKQH